MKRTLNGETSNAAVKRAEDAGEYVYYRSNHGRWYVMQNGQIVFGDGLHPAHYEDCVRWVNAPREATQ